MLDYSLEDPLTFAEDSHVQIVALFVAEANHLATTLSTVSALSLRREAVSLIRKAEQPSGGVHQTMVYLAVNYLDRFLSKQNALASDFKPWLPAFLSVTCLSLAAKMLNHSFPIAEFQAKQQVQFDPVTIDRMEFVVISTLDWRLRSITPFAFFDYFLSFFPSAHLLLVQDLKDRASRTLFHAQNEIKLLGFNPSLMAASALLDAAFELCPAQFPAFELAMRSCAVLDQRKTKECYEIMRDVKMAGCTLVAAPNREQNSETPVVVLEGTGDNELTVGCSSDDED